MKSSLIIWIIALFGFSISVDTQLDVILWTAFTLGLLYLVVNSTPKKEGLENVVDLLEYITDGGHFEFNHEFNNLRCSPGLYRIFNADLYRDNIREQILDNIDKRDIVIKVKGKKYRLISIQNYQDGDLKSTSGVVLKI